MAFDGHQSTFVNSLFQTPAAGVNMDSVNGVPFPSTSVPGASLQEQDNTSRVPWSHNTWEDPFALPSFSQTSIKKRKPLDSADSNCETDLQDLVSNILDEGDPRDINCSESLPTCTPVWSPETLREERLQYFHKLAKILHSSVFPSNQMSHETFSKTQQESVAREDDELNQESIGHAINQQWLIDLPNGDSFSFHPQKLPPGLPIPNTRNTDPSQMQQSKYVSMSAYNDRGNDQPMDNYPELSDIFKPQNKTNHYCFDAFYEDRFLQPSVYPIPNEEHVQGDMNQLVSGFQSFVGCEDDSVAYEEFPNMYKQTVGMHKEDGIAEQYKITGPAVSMWSAPVMQIPKQLLGDLETVQRRGIGVRKQTFKVDAFQDLSDFSLHHTEYFQPTKELSTLLKNPNQYQSKMTMNRENVNLSKNQGSKHHIQQSQTQENIKPQVQKEKKRMPMSGFLENGFTRKQQSNTHMTERDKQPLTPNPYFDFRGTVYTQRLDGQKAMFNAGNMQQFTSSMYPINDLWRNSSMPMASNFSPRSTLSYGNGVPGICMGGMMSVNEAAALRYYVNDMRTHRENTINGTTTATASSLMMNKGRPMMYLCFYLDECYKQWWCLENERTWTETILRKTFPGKWTTEETNANLKKSPTNPSRIDRLSVNQIREQAKVASLLDRMECLCGIPLHINIHTALKRHHAAVCIMQERCKEDCVNMTKHQQQGMNFTEDRDNLLMVMALSDLAATTRRLRTALWCALQMMLPKPVKMQDHHVYEEETTERCSSPFQFYSFHL